MSSQHPEVILLEQSIFKEYTILKKKEEENTYARKMLNPQVTFKPKINIFWDHVCNRLLLGSVH